MIDTCEFSHARTSRRVIARRAWSQWECTDAMHRSKPARKSGGQSTPPSGPMVNSVPQPQPEPPWPVQPPRGRLDHFIQSGHSVGEGGVGVKIPANVPLGHQVRELVGERGVDLAPVLAQQRRDPGRPGRAYTSCSVRDTISSPYSTSNRPHSDSLSWLRMASSRVRMLWALEPVKYCNARSCRESGVRR
jgi:hypothetical protein